jgi:hypothetical protein
MNECERVYDDDDDDDGVAKPVLIKKKLHKNCPLLRCGIARKKQRVLAAA